MRQFLPLGALLSLAACAPAVPDAPVSESTIHFIDVAQDIGFEGFRHQNGAAGQYWFPETMGAGGGFADLNADGHLDVILVAGGGFSDAPGTPVHIYMNTGDGTFRRDTAAEPRGLSPYGFGIVAADVDGDDDVDVFYTALGRDALLINENGVLKDAGPSSGIRQDEAWSTAATFFDADGDGWLDLYVARYVTWSPESDIYCSQDGLNKGYCTPELYPGSAGHFYRNRGDGTFEDQTVEAGFSNATGKTLGTLVLDHNRDGSPDLMLANDTEPDELYLNNGDGTFREIGVISGIAFDERGRARAGMGVDSGVVDETGQETLFVGNFSSEMIGVYRHMGNDVFLDRAASSRIGQPSLLTLTFGLSLLDVDRDGDLDLFAANGHVQPHIEQVKENISFRQQPQLFRNLGDGVFKEVAATAGLSVEGGWLARASAWGDFDNDGDPDLLVTENDGPVHLLRNDTEGSPGVTVVLPGGGVGSHVTLWAEGRAQTRFVRTGGSYLAQSQLAPLFGIGEEASADSVVVAWPGGSVTRLGPVAAGETVWVPSAR